MSTQNGSNKGMVPEARAAMDRFKMEAASDLDVKRPQKQSRIIGNEPSFT
ncbi:MAG: small, acid-soluble spore protein, alpha/beta type [Butyricicoccus pullicaecorum]|nr:small, acid-soluble spore protein, alpha/beta type [Butyricicoccus pullicaecorum]